MSKQVNFFTIHQGCLKNYERLKVTKMTSMKLKCRMNFCRKKMKVMLSVRIYVYIKPRTKTGNEAQCRYL